MSKPKTRTTKVEHKAPDMCGQECVDKSTYRQSEMSNDDIKGLLNITDIFCFQLYVKIPLFRSF